MRRKIRAHLKTHLSIGTQAEDRVFVNRENPIEDGGEYPVILIYSGPESAEASTIQDVYARTYSVTVEARVKSSDQVDDDLDDISDEIEELMKSFKVPNLKGVFYTGADPEQNSDGEENFGSIKLTYDFKYFA